MGDIGQASAQRAGQIALVHTDRVLAMRAGHMTGAIRRATAARGGQRRLGKRNADRPLSQVIILGLLAFVTFGGTWIDNEIQIRKNDGEKTVQSAAEREIIDKIQPALEEYYDIDIFTLALPQTPSDDGRALLRHEGEPNEGCDLNVVNNEYRISCDSADLEHATELTPRD